MPDKIPTSDPCGTSSCCCEGIGDLRQPAQQPQNEVCCGAPPPPPSDPMERPGYRIMDFVERFITTPAGPVPIVSPRLKAIDKLGTLRARVIASGRDHYLVAPGLYGVGSPGPNSAVLVTANYKLSFDTLRSWLAGLDAWILVLDTRGINVWCAAGKALFSTDEVVRRVKASGLDQVVTHRELILPQLSATGVCARDVKKGCGFRVIWGPVRASDIKIFLENGKQAESSMRLVAFPFKDRMVLTPVELYAVPKYLIWALLIGFCLSGIGSEFFSFQAAWSRGGLVAAAYFWGIISGIFVVPALLPWIPGNAFAVKGALVGGVFGLILNGFVMGQVSGPEGLALFLVTVIISSYLAMNFTGSTPFTSPSGVEKEMRVAIPAQLAALVVAVVIWVGAGFMS